MYIPDSIPSETTLLTSWFILRPNLPSTPLQHPRHHRPFDRRLSLTHMNIFHTSGLIVHTNVYKRSLSYPYLSLPHTNFLHTERPYALGMRADKWYKNKSDHRGQHMIRVRRIGSNHGERTRKEGGYTQDLECLKEQNRGEWQEEGSKALHMEGFKSIIQMLGDTKSGRRTWKRKEGRGETNGFNTD